ncbi:MAG: hypothetical protein ABI325_08960 [Ginsengibacter sp.]
MKKNESASPDGGIITHDSLQMQVDSTVTIPADSMLLGKDTSSTSPIDSSKNHHIDRNPASVPQEQKAATGTAMVYCPATMLRGIPSIINATISKDELSKAIVQFKQKIQEQNSDLKEQEISSDIKSNQIDLYERMGVTIEFDSTDFIQISKDKDVAKAFGEKNTLEWEWYIKPLHSTRRSIINFKFYYLDLNDNTPNYIFEKTISVAVRVDPRTYVDQWKDFLLGDPKNTTTAILIPLCTFLGGFITGKKKKKGP